jgi:hypothetical protein
MERRTVLQYLPVAIAISASPVQLLSIAERARKRLFNPLNDRERLLGAIADRILPATVTPSATEVGVPTFIQLVLEDLVSPEEKEKFYTAMDQFARNCVEQYGIRFEELPASGQDFHLTVLLQRQDPFCMQMKEFTITAYFTSKQGMTEALDYNPIPRTFNPCVQVTRETKSEASYF